MTILSSLGYSVYVDWIIDKEFSREEVTYNTAVLLRLRMKHSRCLFFVTSKTTAKSIWMPWELGYMDGHIGKVAILPLTGGSEFKGQEYLGVYPYVDKSNNSLWIHKDRQNWVSFERWLKGEKP